MSKELKHTKGPWKWLTSPSTAISPRCFYIVQENSRDFIVREVLGPSYEESKANAILISSAPQLLEALIKIVEWDKRYPYGKELGPIELEKAELEFLVYIAHANDVINKATS